MTTRDEFYHWWSGLTNEERVSCGYDLDAMAHGEVVSGLRSKLSQAQAEIAALRRCVEAAGYLRNIAGSALPYSKIMDGLAVYDVARAAVGKGTT